MKAKEIMYARIEKHGNELNAIYDTGIESVQLCKKLYRLESKAHRIATEQCNGKASEDADEQINKILKSVSKILGPQLRGLKFNGDCRGYALKIDSDVVRKHDLQIYRDWGGNGILAPEFDCK